MFTAMALAVIFLSPSQAAISRPMPLAPPPAAPIDVAPLAAVRLAEVAPNVLHLEFPTQYLLASTFLRFQEHYESPKFRGQTFSLETYMDWYAQTRKHGNFSYFSDWGGFNIPSAVLEPFEAGHFDPLSRKEKALLELVRDRPRPIYLIGTSSGKGDVETLRHEIAHGLYSTNPEYRRLAEELLSAVDLAPVFAMLERLGYHPDVWRDEAHAWLGDALKDSRKYDLDTAPYRALHRRLLDLYRKFATPATFAGA
jgi:hypothetical protein